MSSNNAETISSGKPVGRHHQVVKYKKALQAPKRFKNSYMFFSIKKNRDIRAELLAAMDENVSLYLCRSVVDNYSILRLDPQTYDEGTSTPSQHYIILLPLELALSFGIRKEPNLSSFF